MSVIRTSHSFSSVTVSPLERAILETLAYSDIFDYPLTLDELHRYLIVPAAKEELEHCLQFMDSVASIAADDQITFYHLAGRSEIVEIRKRRESASHGPFRRAVFYGRLLSRLPFVRMVAMTGSLAMLNLSKNADMDFMLVTSPNRLWIARAFAVTFGRLMRLVGDRICVNLLVSENALAWPRHDLYSAREMGQMIPIAGMEMYRRLREANPWVEDFLSNAPFAPNLASENPIGKDAFLQRVLEFFIPGGFGSWLDGFLMKVQVRKITRKYGEGADANFNADVCQGNFHDHRIWADEYYRARLVSLGLETGEGMVE